MFTVTDKDRLYNSPFVGNGEIGTALGPTGYHGGPCPEEEKANRALFWAGRRFKDARGGNIRIPRVAPEELFGATIPLIRFGRLDRTFAIDGRPAEGRTWRQTMDYDGARVVSELDHGDIRETTTTLACMTFNAFVFHTRMENRGTTSHKADFGVAYVFGDSEGNRAPGTRLFIRKPHPDDVAFGDLGGVRATTEDLNARPPHLQESLSVQYEIDLHLGEVRIGRSPVGVIQARPDGGTFHHELDLAPGTSEDLWFWVALSDRLKYTHFPSFEKIQALVQEHRKSWADFWAVSAIDMGQPELEAIRKSSLYTIRANTSPWSITMGNQSTTWEGRIFHDEYFGFMGLLSSGHDGLAERAPRHRLTILPVAQRRSNGHGAFYAWEAVETGEESAPYGHWVDERFIHGQFSEEAWQFYLRTGSRAALDRYYPVLKGCAEWLIHDAVVRDADGTLRTRSMTDIDEGLYPVKGSIYITCAAIRSLENASRAAAILKVDTVEGARWAQLAGELRASMPVSKDGTHYAYSRDADLPNGGGHLGMVFPFSVDITSERARNTISLGYKTFLASRANTDSDQVLAYTWMWALSFLATALFYQGRADEGYDALTQVPAVVGPFRAPNEQMRKVDGAFLTWYPTGAGMYAMALTAMFVQVYDENGAILLHALPSRLRSVRFHGLLASDGVRMSGEIRDGVVVRLDAASARPLDWRFRLPTALASSLPLQRGIKASGRPGAQGLVTLTARLAEGTNALLR